MADYSPVFSGGALPYTSQASATITGGQVLIATGVGTVGPAGAAATAVVGIAANDAASGAKVTVWPLQNVVHEIVTANNVTAAGGIQTAASGTVDPVTTSIAAGSAAGTLIGIALNSATAPAKVQFIGRT